jgi:catechol 2,3-dioxygenase-like lactoylglutathione lyase family enzyme
VSEQVPYHMGVIVDDVRAAMAGFSATLGYTFNEPLRAQMHDLDDRIAGTRGPSEVFVTYSRTGPFRVEIIEINGSGVYGSAVAGGVHHIGIWEDDPETRLKELESAGDTVDAVLRGPDGSISIIYARPDSAYGVRVEYVNSAQRERLERWFDTGVLE